MIDILALSFASFGISTLLAYYDGPFGSIGKIRSVANLPECSVCVSVWTSILLSIVTSQSLIFGAYVVGFTIFLIKFSDRNE